MIPITPGGLGIVEHSLERVVHAQGLADLLHGARVVARITGGGALGSEDERLQGGHIGKALISLDVLEDGVEQRQRRPGREEVLHVGVPRAIEARCEQQPGVVVEWHEPGLVNRRDGHAVVPRLVARVGL